MKNDIDIGNLIYVVLTILFLLIGAFGRKKRPVNKGTVADSEEGDIKSKLQELFNEFNSGTGVYGQAVYDEPVESQLEEEVILDTLPVAEVSSPLDTIPDEEPPIDRTFSGIDSTFSSLDLAKSNLDVPDSEEGVSVFDKNRISFQNVDPEFDISEEALQSIDESLTETVEQFDARKAFVYSEIFRRKDF